MRHDLNERLDEILAWIGESQPKAFICRQLNCQRSTLDSFLRRNGITYAGNSSRKGFPSNKYIPLEKYLKQENVHPSIIKRKMLKEGYKEYKCEICSTTEWCGEVVPLCIDHIDGNNFNNDINNLRIICFNCHAQTETYAGRSKGKKLK